MDDRQAPLSEIEMRAWRSLLHMSTLLASRTARPIQVEFGLSEADCAVLAELTQTVTEGGWIRISELIACLGWEKSRLSHQLSRMEKRGLIARKEYADDRRTALVAATQTGRSAIVEATPRQAEEIRRLFLDHLSPGQIIWLTEIAERITEKMRAAAETL
ncbi:MarR family transcriptional regulator [Streptomyces sp. NPDC097941]|uniref:MarR family winged helix-turn-helix transcriptional regulator n=1 Tax=Streptomyces sp. NPDC097941 TaxID=3155685 RepID=UPI003324C551